jgi:hypothetical protein
MATNIKFEDFKDKELKGKLLDHHTAHERMIAERGWLGRFWGTRESVPYNIASFVIAIMAVGGLLFTAYIGSKPVKDQPITIAELWKILAPFITLSLGYIFGTATSKEKSS